MSQIENFRQVLGLDVSLPKPSAPKVETGENEQVKREKETNSMNSPKSKKKQKSNDFAKSIRISSVVHRKVRLLGIWLDQNDIMQSPTVSDIVDDMLEFYVENKFPKAKTLIGRK